MRNIPTTGATSSHEDRFDPLRAHIATPFVKGNDLHILAAPHSDHSLPGKYIPAQNHNITPVRMTQIDPTHTENKGTPLRKHNADTALEILAQTIG